jgi:hypothetical protein
VQGSRSPDTCNHVATFKASATKVLYLGLSVIRTKIRNNRFRDFNFHPRKCTLKKGFEWSTNVQYLQPKPVFNLGQKGENGEDPNCTVKTSFREKHCRTRLIYV